MQNLPTLLSQVLGTDATLIAQATDQIIRLQQQTKAYSSALLEIAVSQLNIDIRVAAVMRLYRAVDSQVYSYENDYQTELMIGILNSIRILFEQNNFTPVLLNCFCEAFNVSTRTIYRLSQEFLQQIFINFQPLLLGASIEQTTTALMLLDTLLTRLDLNEKSNEVVQKYGWEILHGFVFVSIQECLTIAYPPKSIILLLRILMHTIKILVFDDSDARKNHEFGQMASHQVVSILLKYDASFFQTSDEFLDFKDKAVNILNRSLINKFIDQELMSQFSQFIVVELLQIQTTDLYRDHQYAQTLLIIGQKLLTSDDSGALVNFRYFEAAQAILGQSAQIVQNLLSLIQASAKLKFDNFAARGNITIDTLSHVASFVSELCLVDEHCKNGITTLIQSILAQVVQIDETEACQINLFAYFALVRCLGKQLPDDELFHCIVNGLSIFESQLHPVNILELCKLIQEFVRVRSGKVDVLKQIIPIEQFVQTPGLTREHQQGFLVGFMINIFINTQNPVIYRCLSPLILNFVQSRICDDATVVELICKTLTFNCVLFQENNLEDSMDLIKSCITKMECEQIAIVLEKWFAQISTIVLVQIDRSQLQMMYECLQMVVTYASKVALFHDIVLTFIFHCLQIPQESYRTPLYILYLLQKTLKNDDMIKICQIIKYQSLFQFIQANLNIQLVEEASIVLFGASNLMDDTSEQEIVVLTQFIQMLIQTNDVQLCIFASFFIINLLNSLLEFPQYLEFVVQQFSQQIVVFLQKVPDLISNQALPQEVKRIYIYATSTLFFQLIPLYSLRPETMRFFDTFVKSREIQLQLEQFLAVQLWIIQDEDLSAYFRYRGLNVLNRRNIVFSFLYLFEYFSSAALYKLSFWAIKENAVYFSRIKQDPPRLKLEDFSEPTQQILNFLNPVDNVFGDHPESFFARFEACFFAKFLTTICPLLQTNNVMTAFTQQKDVEVGLKMIIGRVMDMLAESAASFSEELGAYFEYLKAALYKTDE